MSYLFRNRYSRPAILMLAILLSPAATAWANTPAPPTSPVTVTYIHPDTFTEMRSTPPSERQDSKENLSMLKRYIRQRAESVLAPGQQLSIRITDVALAGQYEPWPNSPTGWIRVVRNTYPPRIVLAFTLRNAHGKIIKEGRRTLTNLAFMDNGGLQSNSPIHYSKDLVNRWLRRGVNGL